MSEPRMVWDVLEAAPPAQRHSDTSVAAAEAIRPHAGTLLERVMGLLEQCHHGLVLRRHEADTACWGYTDEEMQEALAMNPSTQRPRRVELVKRGLVADTGLRRATRSGRLAVVWGATRP